MRTNAPRTRSRTRVCKTQKFSLPFFFSSAGGVGGADKKWKGNFWFCFAVSVSEKSTISLSLLVALFSALTATEALPYPSFVVTLTSANHTQSPTHSPLTSFVLTTSALCVFARWLRQSLVITQRIWFVLSTSISICACPTRPMRAQIPAVFRRYYKTAGLLPSNIRLNLFSFLQILFCQFRLLHIALSKSQVEIFHLHHYHDCALSYDHLQNFLLLGRRSSKL